MNKLYFGDNLHVLRQYVKDETVDLIYLDPPFNSQASYNVLFKGPVGKQSTAQVGAFEDTWHWGTGTELALEELRASSHRSWEVLCALRSFLGSGDIMAYLTMMSVRLVEMHRVLKPTGSLYLHCDPTASHYLKIMLDAIFGPERYLNEIIWRRTGSHNPRRSFGPVHDVIHAYAKTSDYKFNIVRRPYMRGHVESRYTRAADGRMKFSSGGNVLTGAGIRDGASGQQWRHFNVTAKKRHWAVPGFYEELMPTAYKSLNAVEKLEALYQAGLVEITPDAAWPIMVRYLDERDGTPLTDLWTYQPYTQNTVWGTDQGIDQDVAWLGPTDPERLGYPTQKPVGLLQRIIESTTAAGDVVLDPFCGCGTSIHAAQKLKRAWLGIDVTHLAVQIIEDRIKKHFPAAKFQVVGRPEDEAGARDLAARDKFQFQFWSVSAVGGQPRDHQRKGKDGGVDGIIYFKKSARRDGMAVVSVKGGHHLNPAMIRELHGTVGQEGADVGIFVCLETPSRDMKLAATAAGFVDLEGRKVPKIQIVTINDLFTSARPVDLPPIYTTSTVLDAVKRAAPRSSKRPKPEELRKSPSLKLPIPGGKESIKPDISTEIISETATAKKPTNKLPSPTKLKSLRREPQLKLPIAGGKSATKIGQYTIDLPELSMAAEGKSHYRAGRKRKEKR